MWFLAIELDDSDLLSDGVLFWVWLKKTKTRLNILLFEEDASPLKKYSLLLRGTFLRETWKTREWNLCAKTAPLSLPSSPPKCLHWYYFSKDVSGLVLLKFVKPQPGYLYKMMLHFVTNCFHSFVLISFHLLLWPI